MYIESEASVGLHMQITSLPVSTEIAIEPSDGAAALPVPSP